MEPGGPVLIIFRASVVVSLPEASQQLLCSALFLPDGCWFGPLGAELKMGAASGGVQPIFNCLSHSPLNPDSHKLPLKSLTASNTLRFIMFQTQFEGKLFYKLGLIYLLLRSYPGEGNDNPLQYSCLENPTERGAWWAAVPRITKSWTRLSN